ncbi:hypothetical protein Sste5346_009802 [Sporothrix stenoceras]|uniref:Uncharacterized protein n=1 Tax=Sporothrix stenoceras TaxID=5173 RepID=A0ABR3YJ57_9PEZI
MPPSPSVLNATLGANSARKTTNSTGLPLNVAKPEEHEQIATSDFVTIAQPTTTITLSSPSSAFPSETFVYYPGMPGGGLFGANSASDSHAGVAVGVSCGILGLFLIAVAVGFARHIQRSAKNEATNLTARSGGAHDNFRLQPVSGQQHRQNRQRQRQRHLIEPEAHQHEDLQAELARQWQVHHPIRILSTPVSEVNPRNNTPSQPKESVEVQPGDTMQMARS